MTSEVELLERIRALEDRQAIMDLYAHYYWLIDTRQWARIGEEIFAADGEMVFGHGREGPASGQVISGGAEVAKMFKHTVFAELKETAHYASNILIECLGDVDASVRRYLQTFHWLPQEEPGPRPVDFVGVGVCFDTLRKVDGTWRLTRSERRSLGPTPWAFGAPPQALESAGFGGRRTVSAPRVQGPDVASAERAGDEAC